MFVCFSDGGQGPAKKSVDVQRNRIIATSALKKAEPLAEKSEYIRTHIFSRSVRCTLRVTDFVSLSQINWQKLMLF